MNQMSVVQKQMTCQKAKTNTASTSVSSKNKGIEKIFEKVMENTNLVCSFLKTVCVGMPIDDNHTSYGLLSPNINQEESGRPKTKPVSLENFVANILHRTKLTDTFVHVALLYINRYLKLKAQRKQSEKMKMMSQKKMAHPVLSSKQWFELYKKGVYLPKGLASKISHHSHRRHSISKGDTKIKMNQQSLEYLYQQTQSSKKDKKSDRVVIGSNDVKTPKESLIKTLKDLIFVAMICSCKYLDDNSYCNSAWVKLTDKSLKEVFELEREFLMSLDYKLYFTQEEWDEWYIWISHFKTLVDSGMTSTRVDQDKSSLSCIVSIPSQASLSPVKDMDYAYPSTIPSPVDIPTPTSATFSSKIPFSFEEGDMEEDTTVNYSNNAFLPSLSAVASFVDYCSVHPQLPSVSSNPYLMAYSRVFPTGEIEESVAGQHQSLYQSSCLAKIKRYRPSPSVSIHCSKSQMMMSQLMRGEMRRRPRVTRSSYYWPFENMRKVSKSLNAINGALLYQAQNSTLDFTEIQELSQKQNFIFKKPVLPPRPSSTSNNPFDIINLNLKLAPSSNTSNTNFFIPPLY